MTAGKVTKETHAEALIAGAAHVYAAAYRAAASRPGGMAHHGQEAARSAAADFVQFAKENI